MSNKLQNIKAINQMLDGTHKFQTKKTVGFSDAQDAAKRSERHDVGDVWEETDANGVIIPNSTKVKEKIIIPANTKCIFDEFGEKDKIMVRFEEGKEKTLTFDVKPNNKRYYLDLDPNQAGGPKIKYGKKTYKVDLLNSGGTSVYLLIKKTNQQTRTRGRVVRGMKV